jgi:hypothetical protein
MRFYVPMIAAASLIALQAYAQNNPAPSPAPAAPAPAAPPAAAPSPSPSPSAGTETGTPATPSTTHHTRHHARRSLQERFEAANTTHDGHLTLEQAQSGMPSVAKNFDAIDKDKKGYVTLSDIRNYYAERRSARHSGATHGATSSGSPSSTQ